MPIYVNSSDGIFTQLHFIPGRISCRTGEHMLHAAIRFISVLKYSLTQIWVALIVICAQDEMQNKGLHKWSYYLLSNLCSTRQLNPLLRTNYRLEKHKLNLKNDKLLLFLLRSSARSGLKDHFNLPTLLTFFHMHTSQNKQPKIYTQPHLPRNSTITD